jgi:hypothetical protein
MFLNDTPFLELFYVPIPLPIPKNIAFEHRIITAGTGAGKTTLLETLILKELRDPAQPAIVVIDSQQQLIAKLSRLALCHARRLVIIDPKDSPALNPFDQNLERLSHYDDMAKEQLFNHTLETFNYLFEHLLGSDLTTRQTTLFTYVIMLMLAMPEGMGRNATLYDLIEFTETPDKYAGALERLPEIAQRFFRSDFPGAVYKQTREQIRYRLHAILGAPSLARLFLAPSNTLDLYEALSEGAIILIDTDKAFLGAKNSSYFGRVAITLLLQAVLERGAAKTDHRPAYIFIDEAAEVFDRSVDTFLTEARKHKVGVTMAHQHLGQMTPDFRASVAANTGTKYAAALSAADARTLASDMRATPQFLLDQPRLTFAVYIRNVTPGAVSVPVEVGRLEREDQVADEVLAAFRAENRKRLAVPEAPPDDVPEEAPEDTTERVFEGEIIPPIKEPPSQQKKRKPIIVESFDDP